MPMKPGLWTKNIVRRRMLPTTIIRPARARSTRRSSSRREPSRLGAGSAARGGALAALTGGRLVWERRLAVFEVAIRA